MIMMYSVLQFLSGSTTPGQSLHGLTVIIVSAHRWILGMASVVCVLVKICVSSKSLYKLDTVKLTALFE